MGNLKQSLIQFGRQPNRWAKRNEQMPNTLWMSAEVDAVQPMAISGNT